MRRLLGMWFKITSLLRRSTVNIKVTDSTSLALFSARGRRAGDTRDDTAMSSIGVASFYD